MKSLKRFVPCLLSSIATLLTLTAPLQAQDAALPIIEADLRLEIRGPQAGDLLVPWFSTFVAGDALVIPMLDLNTGRAEIRRFDLETGARLEPLASIEDGRHPLWEIAVANEDYVAIKSTIEPGGYLNNIVYIYTLPDLSLHQTINVPAGEDRLSFGIDLAISDDKLAVASSVPFDESGAGKVFVYDLATGVELYRISDPDAPSGFFAFLQSNRGQFPGSMALTDDHLAIAGTDKEFRANRVYLFDAQTGSLIREVAKPKERSQGSFGDTLELDEDRLFVGASRRSNVRILLDYYADIGEIYALDLNDDTVVFRLDDPMPVDAGTETVAYAAATGSSVPFYGSGFGESMIVSGGMLYANMNDFAYPGPEMGAVAIFDATTGAPKGLVQSASPLIKTNFSALAVLPDGGIVGFSRAYESPNSNSKVEILDVE